MLDLSVTLWVNEEFGWPDLDAALAAAARGDGTALLALFDRYHGRQPNGDGWTNALEALQTIRCMDSPERLTVEQVDAAVPRYLDAAPRLAPLFSGWYFCTLFPATNDPRVEIAGTGVRT